MRHRSPIHRSGPRIGEVLIGSGVIGSNRLTAALAAQRQSGARIGEIVARRGWASQLQVATAAAAQIGADVADLDACPLDPELGDVEALPIYLRHRFAPWRMENGVLVYAATDAQRAALGVAALGGRSAPHRIALAAPETFNAAMAKAYAAPLAARAATRSPAEHSARTATPWSQRGVFALLLVAVIGGFTTFPIVTGATLFACLVALNACNAVARIAVLAAALRTDRDPAPEARGAALLAKRRAPPKISILVPLLREPETLPVLFSSLEHLEWPAELLDVKLLLEEGDDETLREIQRIGAPAFCEVLIAPKGEPRTKPRAMNFALDFCEGELIGIYDAEDRPEPDQLHRVVDILAASPPEVACVQCRLLYFNPRENWLTRCFTIEYAIWFDVLLRGFRDLGLPIPLGGTSVFFRRGALERLGGWDAHNVTEDADLGMRLARAGMRCEVSVSTTREEANSRPVSWVRQRSRWLKGYMQTWLCHMRQPLRLFRELGPVGFAAFQTVFLGAMVAYFGLPLFWAVWGLALLGYGPSWLESAPVWALGALGVVQLSGWFAMMGAAIIACARRGMSWLLPWLPTLIFYWPMGAAAAYLALAEMFVAPSHWRKTRHGVGKIAVAEREAALAARDAHSALHRAAQ